MTQPVQILGSFWTLAVGADPAGDQRCHHDFRLRVETAAQAGFTAMGFWHTDLVEILKKYSFQEMKRILDDNGITEIEVEWLLDWFCTDQRRVVSDQTRKLLLDAAEQLRARHIKIGDLGNDCADVPRLTEEFAVLCKQAAERGTNVLFEMLPAPSRAPRRWTRFCPICAAQAPRTAASCWTICICSEPEPPLGHRQKDTAATFRSASRSTTGCSPRR